MAQLANFDGILEIIITRTVTKKETLCLPTECNYIQNNSVGLPKKQKPIMAFIFARQI